MLLAMLPADADADARYARYTMARHDYYLRLFSPMPRHAMPFMLSPAAAFRCAASDAYELMRD